MRKRSATRSKTVSKTPGFIRIIAGNWRGRKLPVHDIAGLRPTTDRVKETVFNWLMQDIRGANCLDCFTGSGALSFEALSRGAQSLTMIELDSTASRQLAQNLDLLGAGNANLLKGDSLTLLPTLQGQTFDVVFIDPPFRQGLAEKVCQMLENNSLLSENALIYVEVESELSTLTLPQNWQQLKEKSAGQVRYALYQRSA